MGEVHHPRARPYTLVVGEKMMAVDESNSRKGGSEHRLRTMKSVSDRTARWLSPKMILLAKSQRITLGRYSLSAA
jgi:hypothetical protein